VSVKARIKQLQGSLDSIDFFFGIFPAAAFIAAFVSWVPLIIRANRGEEVKEDWRLFAATGAAMAAFALNSGTRVRETVAMRSAAVETRELVHEAAAAAESRDRRAAEQQGRLTRLTKWLVALAP
jgi:hypothetical protein